MKKFVVFLMLALLSAPSSAQSWESKVEVGDELKGDVQRTRYKWVQGETMAFAFYSIGNDWTVVVARNAFKPDPTHLNRDNNFVTYATIGFYDVNGNLINKYEDCTLELTDIYTVASSSDKKTKKPKGQYAVSDFLRNEEGFIRILIPTQFGNGFDIKIPCLANSIH